MKVIDRVLDAASGTFGVRLELPNRAHNLPAGVRCKAAFTNVTAKRLQELMTQLIKEYETRHGALK